MRLLTRLPLLTACVIILHGVGVAEDSQPSPKVPVTFYSSGSFLKGSIPGYKYGKFAGRIMDGHQQLAMLEPDRFVTFNLDPGEHTFTANTWMISSPAGGGHIKLDLVPGQHYYVGAYIRTFPLVADFRMEQRSCQQAQDDNRKTKPLDQKHLRDYGSARVLSETTFPACP
jgi:hypothetical protein